MENNKNKLFTLIGIIVILISVVGLTYAYFVAQAGGTTSTNATVTSNTTDVLTFSMNQDISFTVSPREFTRNSENQSGEATVTAILTPNNKTGSATMNYYLILNLKSNPITYSTKNVNQDPELMLQVFDGNNQLVTLTGLGTQKTIKGVTGYDITGVRGSKTLLNSHQITASNNTAVTETWRVVITLINLDVGQNDNTNKTLDAKLVIVKDLLDLRVTGTIYRNNSSMAFNNNTIEEEIGNLWCYEYGGDLDCTWPYATQASCERWGDTCEQGEVTLGVGEYETNVNTIRTKTYNVYCPIGEDNLTCGNNWWYPTEQDCLDDVDTSTYTCTAGTITRPYYLKHEVTQDIIESTEVCLWYNNAEFCFGENYWVETGNGDEYHESAENGEATMDKLEDDMTTALGIAPDNCYSSSNYAECYYGDFYCNAYSDGSASCANNMSYCVTSGGGLSICY